MPVASWGSVSRGAFSGILFCMFLGEDLLQWLMLAIGGALFVGNVMALIRPPREQDDGKLERAPVSRSLVYAGVGLIAAIWALATLIAG